MSKINHDRPELRYKDNFRREFEHAFGEMTNSTRADNWSTAMQPLVQNPRALEALANFFKKLDNWTQAESADWSLSSPPKAVKDSLKHLLKQHVRVSYSNGLRVEDWLAEPSTEQSEDFDVRPILEIFRKLWL
jgi:hypothetical protein